MNKNIIIGVVGLLILAGIFYYVKDMRDNQVEDNNSSFEVKVGN